MSDPSELPPTEEARTPGAPRIRDRHVVLLASAVVAVVLGIQLLSAFVPAIGEIVGVAPVLIGALVVITLIVLGRALRPPRPE